MILVVAPYSPIARSASPDLGAARKIEAILQILAIDDDDIVLINTAHNALRRSPLRVERTEIAGVELREISLPTYPHRTVGKLLNLAQIRRTIDVVSAIGVPTLVWVYNGYAFEAMFAKAVHARFESPVILEFEDWHFARRRGMNPKPFIDYLAWKRLLPVVSHAYAVNENLASRLRGSVRNVSLLPGIVPVELLAASDARHPFQDLPDIRVGFFGGLTHEKGAHLLLEIAEHLPKGAHLHVCGAGELEHAFRDYGTRQSSVLTYHGRVPDHELYRLIAECDILLNPHSPISAMQDGVFPFKVVEAVASGRTLVSTALPQEGLEDMLQGVTYSSYDPGDLLRAIRLAVSERETRGAAVDRGKMAARDRFGANAILGVVRNVLAR